MGDLATVALALAACAGAWAARPLPLAPALAVAVVALALRRPVVLMAAVALAASALGARSWDGLRPPAVGPWSGVATLVGDPAQVAGALRADVRIDGKRVEAWARGSTARTLRDRLSGERVQLRGQLQPVPAAARERLARRHVSARLTVTGVSLSSPGGIPSRLANGLRRTLLRGAEVLPSTRRALYSGFVLGDDREQRPEVTDDFRASGLSHLLVVSGSNVAFVLALLGPFLGRLRLGGRLAGGVAVLVLFGILTRWEPSVLRAVAMAGLTLLTAALGRPASSLRILSLAVTGLVLVDPLLVHSLGFLLSVGACAGIALFSTRLSAWLPGPRPVANALGVTLAAQVGVLPVLVPVFGGLPVAALPANLLGAPVAGPLMMWGMAAGLAAGWMGPGLAGLIHLPTDLMIRWVAAVARWGAAAPLGQLRLVHVAGLAVALALGVASHRRGRRLGVVVAGLVGTTVAVAPAFAVLRPPAVDGRSLVPGARLWREGGASVLVVDDLRASPEALLSALHMADVRRVDVLVVARPGVAAATEVAALLRRFPPRLVLGPTGHRLQTEVVVPRVGSRMAAGSLVVHFRETNPRLTVDVRSARAPPILRRTAQGQNGIPITIKAASRRIRPQVTSLESRCPWWPPLGRDHAPYREMNGGAVAYPEAMGSGVVARNNVTISGNPSGRPMVFAHGFGCDQNMWRFVAPAFEACYRTVLFDYVGAGGSDLTAYDPQRYSTLDGYAADVLEICDELDLADVVFVGHSVSAMVGVVAANAAPERFGGLVLIGPSPRYTNEGDYVGGFTEQDIEELLASLDSNYLGWSSTMAPVIVGNPERPELGAELTASFCRTDPEIQKRFARVTFLSDNREDVARVGVPTLVLQCSDDVIAPDPVGQYVHEHLPGSRFMKLRASGHCPNLSAPEETVAAITGFLGDG